MTPTDRQMHLGDILSITTGRLVSRNHIDGVYTILNHMTGQDLMTHQLPRVADECKPHLLAQHPRLVNVEPPNFTAEAEVWTWLSKMERTHGTTLPVAPLPPGAHEVRNPLVEAVEMMSDPGTSP